MHTPEAPAQKEASPQVSPDRVTVDTTLIETRPVLTEIATNKNSACLDSDADYSNESLKAIHEGSDCKLEDQDLITDGTAKKRLLANKLTPLGLIQVVIAKWKQGGQNIRLDMTWETKDPATLKSIWHWRLGIPECGIIGESSNFNKARAKQEAAQMFLKKFMPLGFTWKMTVEIFLEKVNLPELT